MAADRVKGRIVQTEAEGRLSMDGVCTHKDVWRDRSLLFHRTTAKLAKTIKRTTHVTERY